MWVLYNFLAKPARTCQVSGGVLPAVPEQEFHQVFTAEEAADEVGQGEMVHHFHGLLQACYGVVNVAWLPAHGALCPVPVPASLSSRQVPCVVVCDAVILADVDAPHELVFCTSQHSFDCRKRGELALGRQTGAK